MCLSHWSICPLDGGVYPSTRWHGNKWGMTASWRSSGYGFFNLPDASHWQRLITRWHGAVMFMLSHLFVVRKEGAGGGGVWCVCIFKFVRHWAWVCVEAQWFDVASPPTGQGVIESGAVISVHEVTRCLTNGITPSLPIPASWAACTGGSLVVTASWVGYNSSPHRDRALSQSSSTGLPLLCSVLGKRFSGALLCEL